MEFFEPSPILLRYYGCNKTIARVVHLSKWKLTSKNEQFGRFYTEF